jgi:hypothetical protein
MVRSVIFSALFGLSLVLGFVQEASAQSHDGFFFFLRDPFGRGRSLFNFPEPPPPPPKRVYVEPPSDEATGTVYGSSVEADAQRFLGASEYVVVLGDTLADQLSQGLADAFVTERPEIAIVKKTKVNSGLVRNDVFDWTAQASSLLSKEKATAIVVLIGINDRQPLIEDKKPQEFRSDIWREAYGRRVEEFLIKLRDKNVPIFVVGLPSTRYPKMTLDTIYLNEILAERTRKIGGYYVDVWDGFVTENGDYMDIGPALDGQKRRLRASDGVHFTKAGGRKLAHYVERELVRLFDSRPGRTPAVPQEIEPDISSKAVPAVRPVAGPILPLSQLSGPSAGALVGAPSATQTQARGSLPTDPISARTLIEGTPVEPISGRADDFRWPPPDAKVDAVSESVAQDPPQLRPVNVSPKAAAPR